MNQQNPNTRRSDRTPIFSDIVFSSRIMERVIEKARIVAAHSKSLLITGEFGTGKEMLARAIHATSPRRDGPFVPVYCGDIPSRFFETNLFGYVKDYRGVKNDRPGFFENAMGGTLFLNDVEILPLETQMKMFQTLKERMVVRMGALTGVPIDVRIITATNRNLLEAISAGEFKKRLYHQLSVTVINVPPLRERPGDIRPLADALMELVNEENADKPRYQSKELSTEARTFLQLHLWPGNVTELYSVISQAAIFSLETVISRADIQDLIIPMNDLGASDILNRPFREGFKLSEILEQVTVHYLNRALEETGGNKSKAAGLVGLPNYQTFTNWMEKYGVKKE